MSTIETNLSGAVDRESAVLLQRPPRSLWRDAWRRMRRNKMAMAGLVYITFLIIVAAAAPVISPHNPMRSHSLSVAAKYRKAAWESDPNPKRAGLWDYPFGTDQTGRDVFT